MMRSSSSSSRALLLAVGAFLGLITDNPVEAGFYLPGVAPKSYDMRENVSHG